MQSKTFQKFLVLILTIKAIKALLYESQKYSISKY